MNILLCALNAKFIHSSLALRSLSANAAEYARHIDMLEFGINNTIDFMLKEIGLKSPDILCFSCYIWNISLVEELAAIIRKVSPHIKIILGGPEVSFPPFELLGGLADIIAFGEGEDTFKELCGHFLSGAPALPEIKGIAYCSADTVISQDTAVSKDTLATGNIIVNEPRELPELSALAFPYNDLHDTANKIIYYESSRGCPFSCAYCLSSAAEGVRFLELPLTISHIDFFLKNSVKLVKFVDRTFNCDGPGALRIWRYIIDNDNGVTSFHFEIGADLLTDEQIDCLKNARPGLIQFEAGVQSTNGATLKEVLRVMNFEKLCENIQKIKANQNIHLHIDLIAGLPLEDMAAFKKSFNDCFALRPHMLQLGFLKLLKGSSLRRDAGKYGIVYRDTAPYEVLFTKHMSFDELLILKDIENLTELYYNSGLFAATLEYALTMFDTPFDFFFDFSLFWNKKDLHKESHSKLVRYEILYRYLSGQKGVDLTLLKDLLKFDMFMNENVKNLPEWLERTDYAPIKSKINAFFADASATKKYFPTVPDRRPKELRSMCHIERFKFNILAWLNEGRKEYSQNYCLFIYDDSKLKVIMIDL